MCGIAGFLAAGAVEPVEALEGLAARMGARLVHRGPDSGGTWSDEEAGVAFAHRRLSILDLSPEGAQPMHSESGRFVVTFNGEIYNFVELRDELARSGHRFRGHSDTEVLLAAAEEWGFAGALRRFNGMFAIAIWDRAERLLHLARDRMGEKPVYYGWFGKTFLFASEIKALRVHPDFDGEIDRNAVALLMRHGYIPTPYSIHTGLRKLVPGAMLTVSRGSAGEVSLARYWSPREAATRGTLAPFVGSPDEAVSELDALLRSAVKLRMQADVPLGAFLSGGIDSSTIVALMQAQSAAPVRTFTIGFREDRFNEAEQAKGVASHLGTDHTELYVTPSDALDVIPRLPVLYDEPFADSSQIPTFLVAQLTRRHVTVSLSGDGGDELFCGYTRYALGAGLWRWLRWLPAAVRTLAARAIEAIPPSVWARSLGPLEPMLPAVLSAPNRGQRIRGGAELLKLTTAEAMYRQLVSTWKEPERLVPGAEEPSTPLTDPAGWPSLPCFTETMMFLDAISYLPDDILVKVDRASMGVSLEARVPLLDHRVVELAWRLPLELKQRDGTSKWILRRVLDRYVPRALIERPKMGFGVPIDSWLRGPLREWAEDLLSEDRLTREGFLDAAAIRNAWRAHLCGQRDAHYCLWPVLMFQSWLAAQRS
jgi:asparagine synthase (glutamine-hydrolysing)